ncbi:hypothetical protein ACFYTC_32460 [Actinomadura nitritigenes]|uniref:hypothetical protein n=1 Tax=Actinomadura nitritigenes TaxID=134602 RepID=UPI0036BE3B00
MADISFVDQSVPVLTTGVYSVTATQTVALNGASFAATRTFTVSGDRFTLPEGRITAVFPPDGSLGDHHNVLPHVMLDRPTLPWERSAGVPGPWLVLLLFTDAERPVPQIVRLGDLASGPAYCPAPALEAHQAPDDQVTVIDVPRALLEQLLPSVADLPFLAHLRRSPGTADSAVVLGDRLPPSGGASTAHLVSVEGRYGPNGFDLGPGGPVRLVSLASWRFSCLSGNQTFATLVRDLARHGSPYRLPDSGNAAADTFLRAGYVPVRHRLRDGASAVSWYRGPLATGPVALPPADPTLSSDHLLVFHSEVGMFDASYATAWELGRLLGLRSTGFATALYEWKRRRAQATLRATLEPASGYPLAVPSIDDTLPDTVTTFLNGLWTLDGVPLGYLVPDARLLPVESIRFFSLDLRWVGRLVDGAFSIGRLTSADAKLDAARTLAPPHPAVTGALIRSDVVSGYPGLLVDGFDVGGTQLPAVLTRRLTPDLLLCLFAGTLGRLDVHQSPETLHFAVELPTDGQFTKTLRDASGASGPQLSPMPLTANGRLPIASLAAAMSTALSMPPFAAGQFARQMIETGERISFLT